MAMGVQVVQYFKNGKYFLRVLTSDRLSIGERELLLGHELEVDFSTGFPIHGNFLSQVTSTTRQKTQIICLFVCF